MQLSHPWKFRTNHLDWSFLSCAPLNFSENVLAHFWHLVRLCHTFCKKGFSNRQGYHCQFILLELPGIFTFNLIHVVATNPCAAFPFGISAGPRTPSMVPWMWKGCGGDPWKGSGIAKMDSFFNCNTKNQWYDIQQYVLPWTMNMHFRCTHPESLIFSNILWRLICDGVLDLWNLSIMTTHHHRKSPEQWTTVLVYRGLCYYPA